MDLHTLGCHSEGPEQAQEMGPCVPHGVEQSQAQGVVPGLRQPLVLHGLGDEQIKSCSAKKELEVLRDENLDVI